MLPSGTTPQRTRGEVIAWMEEVKKATKEASQVWTNKQINRAAPDQQIELTPSRASVVSVLNIHVALHAFTPSRLHVATHQALPTLSFAIVPLPSHPFVQGATLETFRHGSRR